MKSMKVKARVKVRQLCVASVVDMDTPLKTVPGRGHSKVNEEANWISKEARDKEERDAPVDAARCALKGTTKEGPRDAAKATQGLHGRAEETEDLYP